MMNNETIFRTSVSCLAAIIVLIGLYTQSFYKMVATYLFGMLAICGVILPDWEFFDRSVSHWCTPVTVNDFTNKSPGPFTSTRYKFYPVRSVVYAIVYGFGLYRWWIYISSYK
ncbi:signal peptidase complex-like protein DTM1 [Nicotiana tomentosiformis]|uniref:signal peptidase complex-like protein DTM1 n=1 Tax=Nicotiana tomentosiformis TaxID=4098 RepID=UPI00051B3DED|nr:signal peptidase complex-like protein DTM1 [Nicotiana tomentosiformis]